MIDRGELQELLRVDRWAAHLVLFGGGHEDEGAAFHRDLAGDFWGGPDRLVILGFRGAAKSTIAEEYVALAAREGLFRCCVFVGPSETRAADRVGAVGMHLKMNDGLARLFGPAVFETDQVAKLVLRGGPAILALGRGQDIRGLKALQYRPDLVIADDFEDKENVLTPEGRRGMLRWVLRELRLAVHPRARFRVLATIMDPECVPLQLVRGGWPVKRYPITYRDAEGMERATWEARFPLSWVERERAEYQRHGEAAIWEMEMMCEEGAAQSGRDFKAEYFPVKPRVRTYEPVWVVVDPSRGRASATGSMTGIVAFSWIGHELVVWEDRTRFCRPSEMIGDMFELEERYRPVAIGFEETGLEEWALEPIRAEMGRRGVFLPLLPVRAPRDKISFIRGLEPHGRSGEISLARELPDLVGAFVGFPRGRIDGPNALAYALVLRPGIPVYEDFLPAVHVSERGFWARGEPLYLALNATSGMVTGVLLGHANNRTVIVRDWVREGDPGAVVEGICREAGLVAAQRIVGCAGPRHFDQWHNVGLVQAAGRVPIEIRQGADEGKGRNFLRRELAKFVRDFPAVTVATDARWSLAAFTAGYARRPNATEPEAGVYRLLMEGVEATLGLCAQGAADDASAVWSFTPDGRRYRKYASAFERRVN